MEELRQEGRAVDEAGLEAVLSYIDPPFEFASASDYCARHGVHVFPIDLDRFSSARLARMEELVSRKNLARLLAHPMPGGVSFQAAIARLFFEKGVRAFSYTREMRLRDRHMSRAIAGIMQGHAPAPARLVHICGWQHLCDPFDLYGPLAPIRFSSMIKLFVFDLGNVILPFDHRQIAHKLYACSEAKGACTPSDIFSLPFRP